MRGLKGIERYMRAPRGAARGFSQRPLTETFGFFMRCLKRFSITRFFRRIRKNTIAEKEGIR
jgi:hypothetical protein